MFRNNHQGFTLIELLIVIGIIAILAAIVIVAVNPARQLAQARNATRSANVNTILNAVTQNIAENGSFVCTAGAISTTTATNMGSGTGDYDICSCLVPTYVAEMPFDPSDGSYTDCTTYDSGYTIVKTAENRVTVTAPSAELDQTISVTR
jgi:prepilin-type N-terminal cleavage/methylation domain-containing protein